MTLNLWHNWPRLWRWQDRLAQVAHQVADLDEELFAEGSARVKRGEILFFEITRPHQADRQRVADGQRQGGGARRCDPQRAGFAFDPDGDVDIAVTAECRVFRAGQADQRDVEALDMRQDGAELFTFAAVADGEHGIAGTDHTEVAVQRFGRVEEEAGCSRRGEGGGDLGPDQSGFPDTGNDQFALGAQNDVDGRFQRSIEVLRALQQCPGFDPQHFRGDGDIIVFHGNDYNQSGLGLPKPWRKRTLKYCRVKCDAMFF